MAHPRSWLCGEVGHSNGPTPIPCPLAFDDLPSSIVYLLSVVQGFGEDYLTGNDKYLQETQSKMYPTRPMLFSITQGGEQSKMVG